MNIYKNKKIKIIVNGAEGKMGRITCKAIQNSKYFSLVAKSTRKDNLQSIINNNKANIVIDFTESNVVYKNSLIIIKNNIHPIIGTSGLNSKQIKQLKQYCDIKKLGGLIVPNFSIGAILMMKFAEEASYWFKHAEIVESHHYKKLDFPSSTAIHSASIISKNILKNSKYINKKKHSNNRNMETKHMGISIHSIRIDGLLSKQDIIFGNIGETLTITHNSTNRSSYISGIMLACEKVCMLQSLHYGMYNLFKDNKHKII